VKSNLNIADKRTAAHNKNYMSIGVSVRTRMSAARNSGGAARQESNPQSPQLHIVPSVIVGNCKKDQ